MKELELGQVGSWQILANEDAYLRNDGLKITGQAMDCINHPERYEPTLRPAIILGGLSVTPDQQHAVDGPNKGTKSVGCPFCVVRHHTSPCPACLSL